MSAATGVGDPAWVRRTEHVLRPDPARVVSSIFLPGQEMATVGGSRSDVVLERVLGLPEDEVVAQLGSLVAAYGSRHRHLEATWEANFGRMRHRLPATGDLSPERRLLIGAYFTTEYALEGAALFNPSMVPHPDQTGLAPGSVRFVMTLRAVGEGHLSSVEMRTGTVDAADVVVFDPAPAVAIRPVEAVSTYSRAAFTHQFDDLTVGRANADFVLAALPEEFSRSELDLALGELRDQRLTRGAAARTIDRFELVASSTYSVEFPADSAVQERVLMPRAPAESHGMEDVRLARFTDDDGSVTYLGTYTAYDGHRVAIQLLRTTDLSAFAVSPLSGPGARDKGLALFPRRIGGRYVAMSRADRESNGVTTSADLSYWTEPVRVQVPRRPWEIVQLGNCGPPIETERGWLVLTHGVGPMRRYAMGALLLDLDDPTVVLGSLEDPFLTPTEDERSGYVPNVVYSCGAMLHGRTLVLPYGASDSSSRIALVDVDALLAALVPVPPGG
jgi:predicted GH43/DUF377 family glycosyl hydrolase